MSIQTDFQKSSVSALSLKSLFESDSVEKMCLGYFRTEPLANNHYLTMVLRMTIVAIDCSFDAFSAVLRYHHNLYSEPRPLRVIFGCFKGLNCQL